MINLSSFIGFHAQRTPDRCALKYRSEDISYTDFDRRIRRPVDFEDPRSS